MLDGNGGLWCVDAGHNRDPRSCGNSSPGRQLDYAPTFQFGHPKVFELAHRVAALAQGTQPRVLLQFRIGSGRHRAQDRAGLSACARQGTRTRLIGRERGYHGVGFGGISVGGIVANRKFFGTLLAGVDHLPATYNRERQAFTKGERTGAATWPTTSNASSRARRLHHRSRHRRADAGLDRRAAAAQRLLAKAARDLRPPRHFADLRRSHHRLRPARLCVCRRALWRRAGHDHLRPGITSGAMAIGGVVARDGLYQAFMRGPEHVVELFHGYTYRRIRWPAPPASPRSIFIAMKNCSSAPSGWSRNGPTPRCRSRACRACSISARSA